MQWNSTWQLKEMNQLNCYWIELIWIELNWFELNWFELIWIDLNWFELIWIELNWFELIWIELIWIGGEQTEDELHLLVTFHNLSAPYTVDCSGAYIEIERESNGFHARWCGSPIAAQVRVQSNTRALINTRWFISFHLIHSIPIHFAVISKEASAPTSFSRVPTSAFPFSLNHRKCKRKCNRKWRSSAPDSLPTSKVHRSIVIQSDLIDWKLDCISVVDLRRADADPHQRSGAYSSVQRSVG